MKRAVRAASAEHGAETRRREQRRFQRARSTLGSGNMSDTKWHEAFEVLAGHRQAIRSFRIKFVGDSGVRDRVMGFWPVNRHWTDSTIGPFENRDVEWLEVVGSDVTAVERSLTRLGRLPIVLTPDGFRIQGYGIA